MRLTEFTGFTLKPKVLGLVVFLLLGSAGAVRGQIPDEFTNLQVLDEEISQGELLGVMRGFSGALGVRCNFCHMGDDPSDFTGYDFASDEREVKVVARGMMRMLGDINSELIPSAGRPNHATVGCVTCHGGIQVPVALGDLMLETVEEEGLESAVARYREVRAEYYGGRAYDFSQGQLNNVTETLARQGDLEDALAIARLNIEFNNEAFPHALEAEILMELGDLEAAIQAMERAVELAPDSPFFKQQLERMRNPG
ncbi:MAG: c-type cytochrome [Longimicrobiales bacterium]